MQILKTVSECRTEIARLRATPRPNNLSKSSRAMAVGFVPTMGALHEGHLSLVRQAQERCATTVVSIFVNPTQFGPREDFTKYPRPIEADRRALEELHVDLLFEPDAADIYAPGLEHPARPSTTVQENLLSKSLCGAERPGHFEGVTTVVAKLLNIVQPDLTLFGQKDLQQFLVIQRMVRDLNIPTALERCATVRESDGLAMSSRNRYLSTRHRAVAADLYRGLHAARTAFEHGESAATELVRIAQQTIDTSGMFQVSYLEIRRLEDLALCSVVDTPKQAAIFVAAHLGATRLIDNIIL